MHKSVGCCLGKISNRCETDCFDIIIHRSKKRKYRLSRHCLADCWFWKIRISLLYCHYAQFLSSEMYSMHNARNNVTNNVIILFFHALSLATNYFSSHMAILRKYYSWFIYQIQLLSINAISHFSSIILHSILIVPIIFVTICSSTFFYCKHYKFR